jgi:hypothetical protein
VPELPVVPVPVELVEPELVVCADATPRQSSSAAVIPNVFIFDFLPRCWQTELQSCVQLSFHEVSFGSDGLSGPQDVRNRERLLAVARAKAALDTPFGTWLRNGS